MAISNTGKLGVLPVTQPLHILAGIGIRSRDSKFSPSLENLISKFSREGKKLRVIGKFEPPGQFQLSEYYQ